MEKQRMTMMLNKNKINYSLYLVTDSGMLSNLSLSEHVESAIQGGVTIVQLREKHCETREFIEKAKSVLRVTRKHDVPLLINDRVDVALAVGCDGVHVGQDDMDCATARRLMGPQAIVGVSVANPEEATAAALAGADYVGVGPVYHTDTKHLTKPTLGPAGVREVLHALSQFDRKIFAVAIAGLNKSNIQRLIFQSRVNMMGLDGIALVSAIMASKDPFSAARTLREKINNPPAFAPTSVSTEIRLNDINDAFDLITRALRSSAPMIHHMTNNVAKNFSANATLAIGATPIMSENIDEVNDLAKVNGGLVVNMGMVAAEDIVRMVHAIQENNNYGNPVVFDPVGAGATQVRRDAVKTFLANGYLDVIKGNLGEIRTVAGLQGRMKGVDSIDSSTEEDKVLLAKSLAEREKNIVVISGKSDIISDGRRTVAIDNGHEFLGMITGSGCTLGSIIASCASVYRKDKFVAAVVGTVIYNLAAEIAAGMDGVSVGTFQPRLLDALHKLTSAKSGDEPLKTRARLRII